MPSLIEDYALIGDCEGAALVAKDGSIDWMCLPRFDSAACFAALLGDERHGRWRISPRGEVRSVRRRYLPGTMILETEIEVDSGTVRLIDFMPPQTHEADVFRIVEGVRGDVVLDFELNIRFDYGAVQPWIEPIERGIHAIAGPDSIYCNSHIRLDVDRQRVFAELRLSEGQQAAFQLSWTPTFTPQPLVKNAQQTLKDAAAWWREWSNRCTYQGPWREDVLRSLITLKSLTYVPTGGIVAAATTSLPEHIGGQRNWDYRYCWLRDATFTLYSLLIGGYTEEAKAWRQWLVHAAAGTPAELQIMYGVGGERRLTEIDLDWLPGYENSRPVRVGNAAYSQHQLDVPGEVMEALHLARRHGLETSEEAWRVQTAIMEYLENHWNKPDEGIWEVRGPRQHFVHSKVMAWVAADRAVKDVERFGLSGDADRWRTLRSRIHAEVYAKGFNEACKAFTQYYGSDQADASLLMLPLVGFIAAGDPKMVGTLRLIEEQLVQDGFVKRYVTEKNVDGLPAGEGAFLLCSFWLVDNYALLGRTQEARQLFEKLLSLRNDVGLLSEEYDPHAGRMLGNFPQAFSHVGLVNSAHILAGNGGPAD